MVVSRGEGVGKEILEAVRAVRASLSTQHGDLAARHAAAVAALANALGRIPASAEVKLEIVEPFSRPFLHAVRQELEQLADEVSGALHAKCAHLDHPTSPALEELARQRGRWARDARLSVEAVAARVVGWVDGGALVFAMVQTPREYTALRKELAARTAFVEQEARAAIDRWLQRAEQDASFHEAAAGEAAASPAERLAALLAKAEKLGVRIRNAPDKPSERYLEKLAIQLAEVEQKKAAAAPPAARPGEAAPGDPGRLAVLLSFADELKVKVKAVPDQPTTSWLDKMEAKLVEVAQRRGIPLPPSLRREAQATGAVTLPPFAPLPPPVAEIRPVVSAPPVVEAPAPEPRPDPPTQPTPAPAPEAAARADAPTRSDAYPPQPLSAAPPVPDRIELGATMEAILPPVDEERRARIESLLERAAETGLELGRVPPDPSDAWVAETEARLEAAIERRKAERRAERKRKEAERQARVEWVREQSETLGVDIGAIPAFPTDDWLARAEIRIQSALLQGPQEGATQDSGRAQRLGAVLEAARAAEVDLGEVPPDPDEVWILWAESQVDKATHADEVLPVAPDTLEGEPSEPRAVPEAVEVRNGFLVYEEGTVQEQVYAITEELELSIGRGRGNTVQIRDDAGVSRRHCTIRIEGGRYLLRDEGSTKGTFVNGRKHEEVELTGDEQVQCGETQFVFRMR